MKNTFISSIIASTLVLLGQNYPCFFILVVYLGIAFFLRSKMFVPVINSFKIYDKKWEIDDHVASFIMTMIWPVSFVIIGAAEYELFKNLYNLPSFRLPYYWDDEKEQ